MKFTLLIRNLLWANYTFSLVLFVCITDYAKDISIMLIAQKDSIFIKTNIVLSEFNYKHFNYQLTICNADLVGTTNTSC